jgi:hypothetical protein
VSGFTIIPGAFVGIAFADVTPQCCKANGLCCCAISEGEQGGMLLRFLSEKKSRR